MIPGKLYALSLKPNFDYKGFIPFQRESSQNYPLKRLGEIPNMTVVLFVGDSFDKYGGLYRKIIYQDKVGVFSSTWATLEEP